MPARDYSLFTPCHSTHLDCGARDRVLHYWPCMLCVHHAYATHRCSNASGVRKRYKTLFFPFPPHPTAAQTLFFARGLLSLRIINFYYDTRLDRLQATERPPVDALQDSRDIVETRERKQRSLCIKFAVVPPLHLAHSSFPPSHHWPW